MTDWNDDQKRLLRQLNEKLTRFEKENKKKERLYQGRAPVINLGIAIPANMTGVVPALGWGTTVVDVISERINLLGFSSQSGHSEVLNQISRMTHFILEFAKAKDDSLVFGMGFLEFLWKPDSSMPSGYRPVITAVDPNAATFIWDKTGKDVVAGLVTKVTPEGKTVRTLHLPNEVIWEEVDGETGKIIVNQQTHNWGIAGLVPIPNNMRSGQAQGHSEITPAIIYAIEHGARAMLGMEYNREFYTAPRLYATNAWPETVGMSEDQSAQKNRDASLAASMSSFAVFPPTEVGDEDEPEYVSPNVGQISASPPTPYIEELQMLTKVIAAESGIPVEYLGFLTDNPSSADAIRQKEARLVKRAELKMRQIGEQLIHKVAPLMWHIVMGEPMTDAERADLDCLWLDASTPTRAAMADAGTKMVGSGTLPPRSSVLYDMMGFTPEQQRRIEADWARDTSRALVGDLATQAAQARAKSTAVAELASAITPEGVQWNGDDPGDGSAGVSGS